MHLARHLIADIGKLHLLLQGQMQPGLHLGPARAQIDRLIGKNRKRAFKVVRERGWGVPGHSWLPGSVPDPFGH